MPRGDNAAVTSYEQLGLFYLGRLYDLATRTRLPDPLLYDSKDLLTHAVCLGMTGSGKTGLGIALIEEAAIDGVPVLAIDPKGDLANLLLTFPGLTAAEFAPWVEADPAGGGTTDARAASEAARWRDGLAEWDQGPERIARLRAAADVTVYTPGSRAGTPLALLGALGVSGSPEDEDAAAQIGTTAASLLALAGRDAEGDRRAHTLLSTILATAPSGGGDLPWLVHQIQRPSFDRVGVLDLDTFYPARERQELALRFNSVLAAPGFETWVSGSPLDVGALLYTPQGRPRVAIVSIAHLADAQRMLVVSRVLDAALAWTRRQPGTSSLRAMIYMDEVFGYLPPVANPPSKAPLLTLLKQARAFGVGLVLATQNPVDLDYKALSNMGTWFLGKLQTERDKARLLDGLEAITGGMDRAALDRALSGLQKRVFLMHNVHEAAPIAFESRWALSYLRGPITRDELKRLKRRDEEPSLPAPAAAGATPGSAARTAGTDKPVLPAGIRAMYLPASGAVSGYQPVLYGAARVHYSDRKRGIDHTSDLQAIVEFSDSSVPVDWARAQISDVTPEDLRDAPAGEASYAALPPAALQPKSYVAWEKDLVQWITREQPLTLLTVPSLGITSSPGERERDFQMRIQQAAREARDAAVATLRSRYAPKVQRLTATIRRAEEALGREQQQAQQQKVQSAVSIGTTLLGALMGRSAFSISTLGRATTAARGVGRSMKETQDISRAEERLREAREELQALEAALEADVAELQTQTMPSVETTAVKPARGGVDVSLLTLAWKPERS
jgi:hypothetical protein